jgi:membrane protease YdiL (CAAX protease family)
MTQETTTAAAKPRGLKHVFVGSQGLRAGWGMLLFAVIVVALVVGLNVALHAAHFHGPKTDGKILGPDSALLQDGLLSAVVIVATLVTAALERRSLVRLGLGLKNALPRLIQGLVVGVAAMSALIGLLYVCGAIKIGALALHGKDIWLYGGWWGLAFLCVGVFEELAFRTYLQQTLARGLNYRWAILIMGVLFTLAHMGNGGETPIGLFMVFAAGLVLSLAVWRTGAVWWSIGFHAAWDWAQSFVYGVADSGYQSKDVLMVSKPIGPDWLSGGSTGPEGSVLALGMLLVVAGVIWLTLRKPDEDMGVKW